MVCLHCNSNLRGRQRKYCSPECKNKYVNNKFQNYSKQQQRGMTRRSVLLSMYGGKCSCCGYKKNTAALCFHHINPEDKSFGIDIRRCSNNSWAVLLNEAKKCIVLCHNCHIEKHNPEYYNN